MSVRRWRAALSALLVLPLLLTPGVASAAEEQATAPAPVDIGADLAATTIRRNLSSCPAERVSSAQALGYGDIAGSTFEREIACVTDYEIARGTAPGSFEPGATVSRRQMALFLARLGRLGGVAEPPEPAAFTDLDGLPPEVRSAIDFLAGNGISRGKPDGRFAPADPVTRGQMATFITELYRRLALPSRGQGLEPVRTTFEDIGGSVHSFPIQDVYGAGIAAGVTPTSYAPDRAVTRAQMAGFLARMLDRLVSIRAVPWAYGTPEEPDAPVYAANGERCTLVGTAAYDTLVGTDGDDVICGLDGSDQIDGGAGNDVLNADAVAGRMRGGEGNDVLIGGSGADQLEGGPGDDVLYGGPHRDVLLGEDGADRLHGGLDDDDLDGGPGADQLDGDGGVNRCFPGPGDAQVRCEYDDGPPDVELLGVTPSTVDVTNGDVEVVVRVRVTSNLGAGWPRVSASRAVEPAPDGSGSDVRPEPYRADTELVSGSERDGVYEARGVWPHGAHPGVVDLEVTVTDARRQETHEVFRGAVTVQNAAPDTSAPVVQSLSVEAEGGFPVDVRSGDRELTVQARVTDDLSGLSDRILVDLWAPNEEQFRYTRAHGTPVYVGLERVSGDGRDGVYRGTGTFYSSSVNDQTPSGDWNVVVELPDRVGNLLTWYGPGSYAEARDRGDADARPLPAGVGSVPVVGDDAVDPGEPGEIVAASIEPQSFDSRYSDTQVRLRIDVVDPDGGTRLPNGRLRPSDGSGTELSPVDRELVAGTPEDGTYELTFFVHQGHPTATWYPMVGLSDGRTSRRWVSPADPAAAPDGEETFVFDQPLSVTNRWD